MNDRDPRSPLQNPCRSDAPGPLREPLSRRRADGRGADRAGGHLAAGRLQASRPAQAGRPGARPPARAPDPLQRATQRAGAADRLDEPDDRLLAKQVRRPRRSPQKDGPMTTATAETLSVVVEREIPFAPEKIWRALTQPHLIEAWLMKNDFKPAIDHRFQLRGDWGSVDCRVLVVEPNKSLSYTWDAMGLESTVTWTLTPKGAGTLLRMEQAGFRPDQQQAYQGAKFGWQKFFASL